MHEIVNTPLANLEHLVKTMIKNIHGLLVKWPEEWFKFSSRVVVFQISQMNKCIGYIKQLPKNNIM